MRPKKPDTKKPITGLQPKELFYRVNCPNMQKRLPHEDAKNHQTNRNRARIDPNESSDVSALDCRDAPVLRAVSRKRGS
jgi:hypothetical protein